MIARHLKASVKSSTAARMRREKGAQPQREPEPQPVANDDFRGCLWIMGEPVGERSLVCGRKDSRGKRSSYCAQHLAESRS